MTSQQLCPWSGAVCCECCSRTFPWKENGTLPVPCSAWREWTRQTFAALIPKL